MKTNIYIELDSLLDTRLNTLIKISPTIAANVIKKNKYINRFSDTFEFINPYVFKKFYDKRNRDTILQPRPTRIFDLLLNTIIDIKNMIIKNGEDKDITIYINLYPYIIDPYENDRIISVIRYKIPQSVKYKVINQYLKPRWIEDNEISVIIKYDGLYWLNRHVAFNEISNTNLSSVVLIVPDIKLKNKKTDDKPIDSAILYTANYMQVEFTHIGLWCDLTLINKNKTSK